VDNGAVTFGLYKQNPLLFPSGFPYVITLFRDKKGIVLLNSDWVIRAVEIIQIKGMIMKSPNMESRK
jgi:hypothetical protein